MTPLQLPASLQTHPRHSQWLAFDVTGVVKVCVGKVELGQGIHTALAQIAADALQVDLACVQMQVVNTATSPNEGMTSGSLSVQDSGRALRWVGTSVREACARATCRQWNLQESDWPTVPMRNGVFTHPSSGQTLSYWQLAHGGLMQQQVCNAPVFAIVPHQAVGQNATRRDLLAKVRGEPVFIHDMRLPGQLFGRVLRGPSPGAQLQALDMLAINTLPGVVAIVRDGNFAGVIADSEYAAVQALERMEAQAQWKLDAQLPDALALVAYLRSAPVETALVAEKTALNVSGATSGVGEKRDETEDEKEDEVGLEGGTQFKASYSRPYIAHASIAPSCAVATWQNGQLTVWSHSQGIFNLRTDLALVLQMDQDAIEVEHLQGAGCYGHNGADDVACDAALLARAVPGRPVQVVWTRAQELSNAPMGPAMAVELQATLDTQGRIARWQHSVWSNGHGLRPGRGNAPVLLAGLQLEKPFPPTVSVNVPLANGGGAERNAIPVYDFPAYRAVSHRLTVMPVRTSALRALGNFCNVFAAESFLDEVAHACAQDPLDFRLRHLSDPRAIAVLKQAAAKADWQSKRKAVLPEGHGLGLAYCRYKNNGAYCAAVAQVDASGAKLRVDQLWLAVDVGLVVNPDGVRNQIEGGAIQSVSWTLLEQVQFDRQQITSTDWERYPILRFSDVPQVEVDILDQPGQASVGAGEAAQGPVAAAIANALFHAMGVRVRDLPLSPDRIRQAVEAL